MLYNAVHQRNASADDGEGASVRTDAPASLPLQITPAKIKNLVKDFKTYHCAMDFDSAFINVVVVKREGCSCC